MDYFSGLEKRGAKIEQISILPLIVLPCKYADQAQGNIIFSNIPYGAIP